MNHFNLPLSLPFRFIDNSTNGIHFNDLWECIQTRDYERKAPYFQKWIKSNTTKLQCQSTIYPEDLIVRSRTGSVLKEITWDIVADGGSYKIYELNFDVSDLDNQVMWLDQNVIFEDAINWSYSSNPFMTVDQWPNLLTVRYKNSFNKDDIAWTTGIEMKFTFEGDIYDYEPDTNRVIYVNQVRNTILLDANYGQKFQLYFADAIGSRKYMLDILDSVMCFDSTYFKGRGTSEVRYSPMPGSNLKTTRVRGYENIGAAMDIAPYNNLRSLQSHDDSDLPNGIVTAYNIITGFFGPSTVVPVTKVDLNG